MTTRAPIRRSALGIVLLAASLAAAPGPGRAAQEERTWLELVSPREPESQSARPLVEVRGHAGARGLRGHDLVLAIDVSDSTTKPCGIDLDGDGPEGRSDPETLARLAQDGASPATLKRLSELDLEDSILFAELAAARVLLERLDPHVVRIGLVAFSDRARVLAPLGTDRAGLEAALRRLQTDFYRDLRGTHLADALHASLAMLRPEGVLEASGREASIVVLSDGAPTLPVHGDRAVTAAMDAADEAARLDVRIYSFAIGDAVTEPEVFRAVASVTGGRLERIERPADAIARLRRLDLADLAELHMWNLTTGAGGRAVRVFPDGSFDGFVVLEPGVNRVRVVAVTSDGQTATADRIVSLTGSGQDAGRELLEELRRRTRETELWAEVEKGRDDPLRELSIEPVPPAEAGGP